MIIIADENIPYVESAFEHYGEVRTLDGRSITKGDLVRAGALLIRSVTPVDAALLEATRVAFVGTATAGVEHVDIDYLRGRGLGFASAAGSNAESVAQWVLCALLEMESRESRPLRGMTLGVIGVGHVGKRVAMKARALGMKVLLNDSPRARAERPNLFMDLSEICQRSDVITLHVPLTFEGLDPTHHLLSRALLQSLPPKTSVLNACRGEVLNGEALREEITAGHLGFVALDVWEHEPNIDLELLNLVDLGTAHIAGYGIDGKLRGTRMLHDAFVDHFGLQPMWSTEDILGKGPQVSLAAGTSSVISVCRQIYDIRADDGRLRRIIELSDDDYGPAFDRLRATYPPHREFSRVTVNADPDTDMAALAPLVGLGLIRQSIST